MRRWARSLAARGVLLALLFVALPVFLYEVFRVADEQRQQLLLSSIQTTGLTVGRSIAPRLARADTVPNFRLGDELAPFQQDGIALRLLFKPAQPADSGFLLVASAPPVASSEVDQVRSRLAEAGVLDNLSDSCAGDEPLALRRERSGGAAELATAIIPVKSPRGCWALVVASELGNDPTGRLGRPYWQAREVQVAAALYLIFAIIVALLAFDFRSAIRQFAGTARAIASGRGRARFADANPLPELEPVAQAFDRMVDRLRAAGTHLRDAAEETAHAFKTPLGTIRQAIEPLRRRVDPSDARGVIALAAVEEALDRLDGLVEQARRLDDSAAAFLDPSEEPTDITTIVEAAAERITPDAAARNIAIGVVADSGVTLPRGGNLLAAALDQVLDNALVFSPNGGTIRVALSVEAGFAALVIEDDGPGVAPDRLPQLFERGSSFRPPEVGAGFGLGLWVVRRNMTALNGSAVAENRPEGGFRVTLALPLE
jgi:two-component system sensor histidine kinase ChvG